MNLETLLAQDRNDRLRDPSPLEHYVRQLDNILVGDLLTARSEP